MSLAPNLSLIHISEDRKDAARKAIEAGLDMDMSSKAFIQNIEELIAKGIITEEMCIRDRMQRDPKWIGTVGTSFNYKGFDLSADLYISHGYRLSQKLSTTHM